MCVCVCGDGKGFLIGYNYVIYLNNVNFFIIDIRWILEVEVVYC